MNKLVLGNVLHRPLRTFITMMAVGIEVVMILSIVGVMIGMLNNTRKEKSGIGADLVVQPSNASFLSGIGGAPVPMAVASPEKALYEALRSALETGLVSDAMIAANEAVAGLLEDRSLPDAYERTLPLHGGPALAAAEEFRAHEQEHADAVLVSQVVTQKDAHVLNTKLMSSAFDAAGWALVDSFAEQAAARAKAGSNKARVIEGLSWSCVSGQRGMRLVAPREQP